MDRRSFLKATTLGTVGGGMVCGLAGGSQDACASTREAAAPAVAASYSAEDHRRRLENIAHSRRRITACLRRHMVTNYLPAQCCYNLGEYPADKPWSVGPYDPEEPGSTIAPTPMGRTATARGMMCRAGRKRVRPMRVGSSSIFRYVASAAPSQRWTLPKRSLTILRRTA